MTPQEIDKAVLRLISGAIDTHIHIGPESRLTRKQDALQLAKTAKETGMRAIMMKNREYGTAVSGFFSTGAGTGDRGIRQLYDGQ